MQETATGKRRASILLARPLADPLPNGLVATLPPLFVPAHFRPQNTVGGENGQFALSGKRLRRVFFCPPPPRWGTGRKGKKGSRASGQSAAAGHSKPITGQSPALCRLDIASRISRAAPVRDYVTPQMVVDKSLDQRGSIQPHHRGMDIEALRGFNRQMDSRFDLGNGWPCRRFSSKPLTRLAAPCIQWFGHSAVLHLAGWTLKHLCGNAAKP